MLSEATGQKTAENTAYFGQLSEEESTKEGNKHTNKNLADWEEGRGGGGGWQRKSFSAVIIRPWPDRQMLAKETLVMIRFFFFPNPRNRIQEGNRVSCSVWGLGVRLELVYV